MNTVTVLNLERISEADCARIAAVDPRIRLVNAAGWFDGEIRDTWPAYASARFLRPDATGQGTREERDRICARGRGGCGGSTSGRRGRAICGWAICGGVT
jgi:hypothetical protein